MANILFYLSSAFAALYSQKRLPVNRFWQEFPALGPFERYNTAKRLYYTAAV
jgi:hypothetical protein